jgi:hypothetical protein
MTHWHVPSKRELPRPWAAEEWQRAQDLQKQGLGFDDIAVRLNRSGRAVRAKFAKENLTAEQRQQRAEYQRLRRSEEIKTRQIAGVTFAKVPTREAASAFAQRDRKLALTPRNLTAAILGDPLPGYSALDRRTAR